jgi:hypothetical protein
MYEKVSAFRDLGKGVHKFCNIVYDTGDFFFINSIRDLDRRQVIQPESEEPPCRYQFLSKQL